MNKKIIFMFLIFFLILILLIIFPYKTEKISTYKLYNKEPYKALKYKDTITQEFISDDNYNAVGLLYADYGKLIKKGNIIITITNENNKTKKFKLKARSLFDNNIFYVKYRVHKNKKYVITVQNNTKSDITFYTTEANIGSARLLDGNDNNNNNNKVLVLSFKKNTRNYKLLWYYSMGLCIFLSVCVLNIGGKNEK